MNRSFVWRGLSRGFGNHCPDCGQGALLRDYLKVVSTCQACGHDNGQYPADDAPPYFTILIVGHLVVAPMFLFSFIWTWPAWAVVSLTVPLVATLTLALLPRVKGAVIGLQWAIRRNEGEIPGQDENPLWAPTAADPPD